MGSERPGLCCRVDAYGLDDGTRQIPSGAIQHWVGAMASKKILAINTDPEANMVTKADYAVIGDLHKVIPAITAEIRRRRG